MSVLNMSFDFVTCAVVCPECKSTARVCLPKKSGAITSEAANEVNYSRAPKMSYFFEVPKSKSIFLYICLTYILKIVVKYPLLTHYLIYSIRDIYLRRITSERWCIVCLRLYNLSMGCVSCTSILTTITGRF